MRVSHIALALPALAAAQQAPLLDQVKGWFARAGASISSALPSVPTAVSVPNPVATGAAILAKQKIERITLDNHKERLRPDAAKSTAPGFGGMEEWMVLVTGGNTTCFGMCERAETAFNESVALISVVSKRPPHMALLDCDTDSVLCNAWTASPPEILYIQRPQPRVGQTTTTSTVRYIPLNRTSVTASELANLCLHQEYTQTEPYEGAFHPFDGLLANLGLAIPFGYFLWGTSKIPSWAFMILVSFASRSFMSRRAGAQAGARAPAAGAPRAAQ